MEYENLNLIQEMITQCSNIISDKETVKGIRAICKWYGGQQIYIPSCKKEKSKSTKELKVILINSIGDLNSEIMVNTIIRFFGGVQIYIPKEARAFKKEIASEVYSTYDGTTKSMRYLCREYNISFAQVYRLWHEGRDEKQQLRFNL